MPPHEFRNNETTSLLPIKNIPSSSQTVLPVYDANTNLSKGFFQHKGLLFVACSALAFSLLSLCVKYGSRTMPSMETVFWRSLVAFLLNLVAVRTSGIELIVEGGNRSALAVRCVVGAIAMALGFYTMQLMVLADATVLIFTSPVMTFFLGAAVLHEKIDLCSLLIAICSFGGVAFVARPHFLFGNGQPNGEDYSTYAVTIALLAAFGQAGVYVSVRRLPKLHYLIIIHYFMLTTTVVSLLYLLLFQHKFYVDLSLKTWLAAIGSGVFGFIGQICLTRGFQLESAGIASVMRYLDVVFVFIWDSTLLREHINPWSFVGAAIICTCAVLIVIRRQHTAK